MNSKFIGGVLLVIGTTIGAGMLALPVATAQLGFWGATVMLVLGWFIMTICALIFLEVNLWLPANTNLISMAGATLGKTGQAIAWFFFLFLLYSIISAYIAGGTDLVHFLLLSNHIAVPNWVATLIFTGLLGSVVYLGIRAVDYVNRGLMFGKMSAYLILVLLIFPFVSFDNLTFPVALPAISVSSVTVTAVAFGCLMIIPSLRTYFNNDHKALLRAIIIGMFIPLLCYIAWNLAIMGIIPLNGLEAMLQSNTSNSDLVIAIKDALQSPLITLIAKFFTSICMATSFLSVSLSLTDFLADGFGVVKRGLGNLLVFTFTFLPPIIIVVFYPDTFHRGLNYAGICVFVLMVLLPALMAWRGRYHLAYNQGTFQVMGGKFLLTVLMVLASLMIAFGFNSSF